MFLEEIDLIKITRQYTKVLTGKVGGIFSKYLGKDSIIMSKCY